MITSRRKKKGGFIDRKHKESRKLGRCYRTMLLPKHVPPWNDFRIKRPSKNCIRMSGKLSLKGIYIPNSLNFSSPSPEMNLEYEELSEIVLGVLLTVQINKFA